MDRPLRVLVVGGGAVGSATAMFLRSLGGAEVDVTVVEPDPALTHASSALSAGSIRQQFSNAINIRMSRFGMEVAANAQQWLGVDDTPVELGFVASPYLFLASAAGAPALRANHAVQRAEGVDVTLLDPAALRQRYRWLNSGDLAIASVGGAGEGWFDGDALAKALARKAQSLGARWRRARVVGFERDRCGSRLCAVRLDDGSTVAADRFVNAAGPWAGQVARLAGVALPVHARRRTVFVLRCPTALPRTPLVVDPSGVWFRTEGADPAGGNLFIAGWSPGAGDPDPDDLPLDQPDLAQFDALVWPALAHRVPAFEALRVQRAWAGWYEVHPMDHNALIGPHPELADFICVNGFSGHGLQHAAAAGRGVAEWILTGGWRTLDLSPFSLDRVASGRPFVEQAII
jgi:FAD-dependent oxidoreductase domain-containing protein 1